MNTRVEHGKSFITWGPVIDTISGRGRMVVQRFHVGINRKKYVRIDTGSGFDPDRAMVTRT